MNDYTTTAPCGCMFIYDDGVRFWERCDEPEHQDPEPTFWV